MFQFFIAFYSKKVSNPLLIFETIESFGKILSIFFSFNFWWCIGLLLSITTSNLCLSIFCSDFYRVYNSHVYITFIKASWWLGLLRLVWHISFLNCVLVCSYFWLLCSGFRSSVSLSALLSWFQLLDTIIVLAIGKRFWATSYFEDPKVVTLFSNFFDQNFIYSNFPPTCSKSI